MLIVIFIVLALVEANVGCIDSVCSSCTSGYLYNSVSCLPMCPTGYNQNQGACTPTSQLNLFTLNFFDFTKYNGVGIGQFLTILNQKFLDSFLSPIPRVDQGFYFSSSSLLACTESGWLLSPDFTLSLLFMATGNGIIFEVYDGNTIVLSLSVQSSSLVLKILLSNSLNQATLQTVISAPTAYTEWVSASLIVAQGNAQIQVTRLSQTTFIPDYEFRYQSSEFSYYIGDSAYTGGSFNGFLYVLMLDNHVRQGISLPIPAYTADYTEFYDGSTVTFCSSPIPDCTNAWPWCIRSSSCSVCFSDACDICNGYGLEDCTACTDSQYSPPECGLAGLNCNIGGLFSCTACTSSFTLIDGLCVNPPYRYNPLALDDPVFDIQFDTFEEYYGGIFSSGGTPTSYSPWTYDPTDNDPIAHKSRGLYFKNADKLISNVIVGLNYKFTISFWIFTKTDGIIYSDGSVNWYSNSCATLSLSNSEVSKSMISGYCVSAHNVWVFNQISVGFSSGSTAINVSINQVLSTSASFSGYAFYDADSLPTIISGADFVGFIYRITLWQTDKVAIDSQYNVCGNNLAASCLWTCDIGFY